MAGQDGFTVAEFLLVAVFVVGLIMVAVTSAQNIAADTRQANCQTELRNLKMAVADYNSDHGRYPTSVHQVVAAGLVSADDVDSWTITSGGGQIAPVYRPVLARC